MDDRLLMGMLDTLTNLSKEQETISNAEPVLVAITGDGEAGNVFHDEVGAPFWRGPGVENLRDVRVLHQRQRLALDSNRTTAAPCHARLDQLKRDRTMKGRGLFRAPHFPHAAGANHLHEPERTNGEKELWIEAMLRVLSSEAPVICIPGWGHKQNFGAGNIIKINHRKREGQSTRSAVCPWLLWLVTA